MIEDPLFVDSEIEELGAFRSSGEPACEPSFTNAPVHFVRQQAGSVLKGFLDQVNGLGWTDGSFGVFAFNTPLVPNSWPVKAPGWHVDGEHRTEIDTPFRRPVEHIICSWTYEGPELSTEYALGRARLLPPERTAFPDPYKFTWLHWQVEGNLRDGTLKSTFLKDRTLYRHGDSAIHRTPWVMHPGKRLLMIATRFESPILQADTTFYSQVLDLTQRTYVPTPDGKGWEMKRIA